MLELCFCCTIGHLTSHDNDNNINIRYFVASQLLNIIINPRRACTGGLQYLVCVCVCVCLCVCLSSTTSPATTSNRRYLRLRRNLGNILLFVQKLWREKANKLISMCLPRHHMVPMERHLARYSEDRAFSGSFNV